MWSTGARYHRDEDSDGFQMSPCLTASSGLLTPPATYNIDARRSSNASSLSSLGPTTPVYSRNPFSDHGYASVPNMETCQDSSMDPLGMGGFSFKASGPEGTSYENWSSLAQSESLDHMPMRMHQGFIAHPGFVQSRMPTFTSVDNVVASTPTSCATSFSNSPYAEYHGSMHSEPDHVQNPEGMWSYHQYSLANMLAAPTMAPNEALLGGEYVQVDAGNQDAEMSSYDDVDVPLAHSPQGVTVKQEELETSADERKVRRSIWVSSTGGKSVKKEQQAGVIKSKKSRKPRSKAITRLHGDRFDLWMDDDVEQIPGTKKWRRNGGGSCGKPQICEIQVSGVPCGRKFLRQEHLHRHMKTHSGRKDFVCQLCMTQFNRNDNCWEHYWTHVHRPGKKNGRNKKYSLSHVLTYITDPKHIEKLHNKWLKEVGYEYDARSDPQAQNEERNEDEAASSSADDHSASHRGKCLVRSRL
ncbi:hypothetical protein BDU57DRAFT_519619 [Ampelomyces quisqualis]|uniref:C2H2 type master regulator of conidiophore development brlA n=1 Tax=Ampelomyces quisqualis TaxID=50730 RepID=A0A6A5QI88_AMPQU|nr:hypothetical protein BDU57DRAFT_519619 [Ampelomyces quisqualis]